ncbi:MAG: DUF935 domain-containing protein, partial [Tannerella sp.]|nr:DUF935 domain-containing protein [Tannerella sp.]
MAKDSKNGNKSKSRKPDTPVLYQNLVIKQAKVDTADINTWKTAVNSAKSGNRSKLYDLYENLLADPFLSDAINKRTDAIVNAEIAFIKDGQTVEEIDSLIDTVEFENLVREIVLSRAWGKSVIEIMFSPEFHIFSYPRRNIRITNLDKPLAEHKKFLAAKDSDNTGYDYVSDSRIIECGDDYDLGLIYRAAPYVIYKRGGFGDWSQFVEIFGMPLLIGKYSMYDERGREKLMEMLTSMGSNPRAAIPEGTDIEVKPNQSFGSPQLYREFRAACNEEILVAVVGNTMTTVAGSSRSQGEVHQNSEEKINRADRRFVQRTLNRYLLPLLIERGYGAAAGGYFVFPDTGENMTAQERIDLALQIRREGIPVSDDYIYDISGIPKPSGKQAKKPDGKPDGKPADGKEKEQEQKHAAPPEAGTVVLDLEPLTEPERGFFERLLDFFADAPAAWNGAIQNFIAKWNGSTATVTFAEGDTAVDIDAASLFGQALRELYTGSEPAVEKHLFEITDRMLQGGINKTFSRAGLEFGQKNQDFIDQFKYSASVFAAFKNHQQTKE